MENKAITQQRQGGTQGEPTQNTWKSEVDHQENKLVNKVERKANVKKTREGTQGEPTQNTRQSQTEHTEKRGGTQGGEQGKQPSKTLGIMRWKIVKEQLDHKVKHEAKTGRTDRIKQQRASFSLEKPSTA